MNFIKKITSNGSRPIYHLQGKNESGHHYHWFVVCPSSNQQALQELSGKSKINISDYGMIIAKGLGHNPSEKTKTLLKEEFNCILS